MSKLDYAGDLTPLESWDLLSKEKESFLIDCRTQPEWQFVGIPKLEDLNKKPIFIEWQLYPSMLINENFLNEVQDSPANKDSKIILICRSGGRSKSAAEFLTSKGYKDCYNCQDGFEGIHNQNEHRSNSSGWKFSKLPWRQG